MPQTSFSGARYCAIGNAIWPAGPVMRIFSSRSTSADRGFDGPDHGLGLGLDLRAEAGHHVAVAIDEELLEVPPDVAVVTLGVGERRERVVQRVAVLAVDVDLLGQRERHAVRRRAELGD